MGGLEHLGRGRLDLQDPHQHNVIERADDLEDLGRGRRSGNLFHPTDPPDQVRTTSEFGR